MGALGAGLLVGTALAVIIPEGFHAFQSAQHEPGAYSWKCFFIMVYISLASTCQGTNAPLN